MSDSEKKTQSAVTIPADDLSRDLIVINSDDQDASHIGLVGDTYTILVAEKNTAGHFSLIDMHIPPGGGPPAHRHDFEESFIILEGEIEVTFRGLTSSARAGTTLHIPANAPHQFRTRAPIPHGCYVSVHLLGRRNFSQLLVWQSPPGPRLHRLWTRQHKRLFDQRPKLSPQTIGQNCFNMPEAH